MPPFARLPTSSSRPPAPWSVPPESLSSGRRPNSLQIIVRTRGESPRASRSACQARRESPRSCSRSACAVRLRVVRVEAAARDRGDARAEAGAEQASEVAERLAEIGVGIGHRRRRAACPPWPAARGGRASRSCCRTSIARPREPGAWRVPARDGGRWAGRPSRPRRPGCRSRSPRARTRSRRARACRSATDPGPSRRGCPAAGCRACRPRRAFARASRCGRAPGPTMPLRQ